MTLPRRRWLVAAGVAVAAVIGAATWALHQRDAPLYERYRLVNLGMSDAQATAILERHREAGPADRPEPDRACEPGIFTLFDYRGKAVSRRTWLRSDGEVELICVDGKVVAKTWQRSNSTWRMLVGAWLAWLRGLVGL